MKIPDSEIQNLSPAVKEAFLKGDTSLHDCKDVDEIECAVDKSS